MRSWIATIGLIVLMSGTCYSEQSLSLDDRFTLNGCRIAGKAKNARIEAAMLESRLLAAHNARKARATYLISYIQGIGNSIDHLDPEWDAARLSAYWHYILEAQTELLEIYRTELRFATDQAAVATICENIAKIERGYAFAKATIRAHGTDWPTP